MKLLFILFSVGSFLLDHGADSMSVMAGDSVTLDIGVPKTKKDIVIWHYNDTRIAQINGDPSKTCTDVQCNKGTERFRGRLKPNDQTGSLTIKHTTTEDSGKYKWMISNDIKENFVMVFVTDAEKPQADQAAQIDEKTDMSSGPSSGVAAGVVVAVVLLQLLV